MDGIINVYKERGFTSFDVVAKLRGILHERHIGHTGTLDPDATGVLPVCVGSATKACELLLDKEKEYEAVLLFGVETDTQDITGKVLKRQDVTAGEEEARAALLSFVGTYEQVPPMYSALKVNGKKLYELAREGKTVERAARPVTIYSIEILETSFAGGGYVRNDCCSMDVLNEKSGGVRREVPASEEELGDFGQEVSKEKPCDFGREAFVESSCKNDICKAEKTIRFRVTCSKGTYIRTLCEDVGRKLGCGGCMKSLKRTRVSSFLEEDAHTLAQIEEICAAGRLEEILMPTDRLFWRYPALKMREGADKCLYNGNKLEPGDVIVCGKAGEEIEQSRQGESIVVTSSVAYGQKDVVNVNCTNGMGGAAVAVACGQKACSKEGQENAWFRVYDSAGRFLALYRYDREQKLYRSVKMFLPR